MRMNVMTLLQNKNDNEMVILISKDGEHLVTFNCGASLQRLNNGIRMRELMFHPSDAQLIAALDYDKNLLLSKNKGATWDKILGDVDEFSFARYSDEAFLAKKERIFAVKIVKSPTHGNQIEKQLIYSDDYFKKWEVAEKRVEFFKLTDCCVYVRTAGSKMKVADAFGNFYYFFDLEVEQLAHSNFDSFSVVDNGVTFQTFGTMVHKYKTYSSNFLMKADWLGSDFKILFNFLVCDQFMSMCDVLPVQSLAGVMMANQYKEELVTFREDIPVSRQGDMDQISRLHNIEDYKMTKISFDYGQTWSRLAAPPVDEKGKPFKCKGPCFLNLHLHSSFRDFNMPSSSVKMPGLIIGTGNVGGYLVNDKNDEAVGLFISEDGGLSWRMIRRGNCIVELLDNGSLIVVADRNYRSVYLEFSFDAGVKWHKLRFAHQYLKVLSLTTKKTHNLRKLLIDVQNPDGYKNKAKVITLDFSNLHERTCHHDAHDPELSDYEEFKPHTVDSDNCFLGQEVSILRKKAERECFNPDKFALIQILKLCPCKQSDYHCDFGFAVNEKGVCVPDQVLLDTRLKRRVKIHSAYQYLDNYFRPPKHCREFYFASTGVRKNFGNFCTGGKTQKTLKRIACPGRFFHSLSGFIFKFIGIAALLGLAFYFNLHFFVIDFVEAFMSRLRRLKTNRDKKKATNYEELPINRDTEAGISHTERRDEEDQEIGDVLQEERDAEASRKINSIFDDEDEDEEDNPIPF